MIHHNVLDVDRQIVSRASRSLEGLWEFVGSAARSEQANAHRTGAGRCGAQQRAESYDYSQKAHARNLIPAKRGKKGWQIHGVRAEMRRAFPRRVYGKEALVETLFSSAKCKPSARRDDRSRIQMREALLLGLAYNIFWV